MSLVLRQRQASRWILLLTVQALLGFATLEGLKVLHHVAESEYPAEETGDRCDCFLCSHFMFLQGETPPVLAIAPPDVSGTLVPCPSQVASDDPDPLPTFARSPPLPA